jgi:hypothetical protein
LWIPNNTIQRQRHESDERHLRNKKRHIESVIKKQASFSSSSVVDITTDSKVQPTSTATLNKKKNQELVFASNSAAKRKTATTTNQQVEEIIGLGQAPLQSFDSVSLMLNKVVTEGVGSVAAAGQWVQSKKEVKETEEKEDAKEESATEESDNVEVGQSVRKNLINAYEDDQEDRRVKLKGIIEGPGQVVDSTDGTPTVTSTAFKKRKIVKANIKKK